MKTNLARVDSGDAATGATLAMTKDTMVEALGDAELLLPNRVTRGLVAHDRVKYYLALLEAARRHALHPDQPVNSLRGEREAGGVDDESLDGVVEQSRVGRSGDLHIPAAPQTLQHLFAELDMMLRPLRSAGALASDMPAATAAYERRLAALRGLAPAIAGDKVPRVLVDALTRSGDAATDSVHQLTLELHKQLNRLQTLIADDVVDGAHTYRLGPGDRALVAAFMKGVAETSPLTFDHPGLSTTATRVGTRLTIQNDIGTADAHVVIVHVEDMTTTIIHTDVHRSRAAFLREMLAPFAVNWRDGAAPAGQTYTMAVGSFVAHNGDEVAQFLTFLGSRLAFLIDWNRARKSLARLVKKSDAAAVLRWAAEKGVGHHAFLHVDGPRLVARAIEATAVHRRAGSLAGALGRDEAQAFLSEVLRITCEGLRASRSPALIQDEVEAEFARHLQPDDGGLLVAAEEHAGYVFALAERIRHVFVRIGGSLNGDVARTAELAKLWEARAHEIVRRSARIAGRAADGRPFAHMLGAADKAARALERAGYLLTLVPHDHLRAGLAVFENLPELVSRAAKEYIRCLEYARQHGHSRLPSDLDAVLVAVDRIATLHRQCVEAERAAETRLIVSAATFRDLHVLSRLLHALRDTADAVTRSAVLVKDHVLSVAADSGGRT